jgi:hypothetical protein
MKVSNIYFFCLAFLDFEDKDTAFDSPNFPPIMEWEGVLNDINCNAKVTFNCIKEYKCFYKRHFWILM